jgi:hypothetical protein
MKTNFSPLAVGGLILFVSYQATWVKAGDDSRVTHPIKFTIQTNIVYGPGSHGSRRDSCQVTWTFRNGTDSALQETVHPNDIVEWHFDSKFFLYIDETASQVDWDKCTDPSGNKLNWITDKLPCPFNQANHRGLYATNIADWSVSLVFPSNAVKSDHIHYRVVTIPDTGLNPQGGKKLLAMPYDYYMVEAVLDWHDPSRNVGKK